MCRRVQLFVGWHETTGYTALQQLVAKVPIVAVQQRRLHPSDWPTLHSTSGSTGCAALLPPLLLLLEPLLEPLLADAIIP